MPNGFGLTQILTFGLMFGVLYFLLIRPQQKRQRERTQLLSSIKKGDRVITIGGLHGTIVDLTDEKVTLKVGENSRLVFERSAINAITDEVATEGSTEA